MLTIKVHNTLLGEVSSCFTAFGHLDFDIVLDLIRHGSQLKRMLELKNTPGLARDDLVMTSPQQEQVGQHRDSHRVRTPLLVPTDLVLAQSHWAPSWLINSWP